MTEANRPVPTSRGLSHALLAYAARRAWHGFVRHRGIDSAAALTFFSTLAIFPAALAVVSALAIGFGEGEASIAVLNLVDEVAQDATVESVEEPVDQLFSIGSPGVALAIGIVFSIWSLSSYATAFGRAVNTVYEVQEGRRFWKFRAQMLLLSLFLLGIVAAMVVALAVTGRVATAIGQASGIGEPWITVWTFGRWPLLLALFTFLIAVLYYVTPNVRHDRMRWVSWGALFAIICWGIATAAFAGYVSIVGQYDRIYGWLGGGIVLLIWLYLTNLVLVLGAEVDAELVRLRQLSAGMAAEETIQLPMRETTRNLDLARHHADDVRDGRSIRQNRAHGGTPDS